MTHPVPAHALRFACLHLQLEISRAEKAGWSADTVDGLSSLLQALRVAQERPVTVEVSKP